MAGPDATRDKATRSPGRNQRQAAMSMATITSDTT